MKKKYQELLNVLLLLFLYLGVFLFPTHVMSSTVNAINLFKEKLFPSIFPFFVLSFLMLNLGISRYISTLLEPFFYRMFHIKGDSIFIIVMSIFSGFPSGPKYIGKLYQEQKITKKESQYLLLFTHFGNPLFILGTCGALLENVSLAGTIFLCQMLSNMIIGIAFRPPKKEKSNLALSNRLKEQYKKEHMPLLVALPDAINNAMEVLLFMLGSVAFFMMISQMTTEILHLTPLSSAISTGILDLTSGINAVASLSIDTNIIAMLMLGFITFGSFSVHLQVINALRKTDLSYHYFFCGRLLQSAIALILFLLFTHL